VPTPLTERHERLLGPPDDHERQGPLVQAVDRAQFLLRVSRALAAMQAPQRALEVLASLLLEELVDVAQVVVRGGAWQASCSGVQGHELRSGSGHWLGGTPDGVEEAIRRSTTEDVVLPGAGAARRRLLSSLFVDARSVDDVDAFGTSTLLVLPLVARGRTFGLLVLGRRTGRGFSGAEAFLAELADHVAAGLEATLVVAESRYVAGVLRRSLAPADLPRVAGLELATFYRVAHQSENVGGDFFDVHGPDDDLIVVCGDVAGKGVEAAVDAKRIRNAVRTSSMINRSPGWILGVVNRVMMSESVGFSERLATATCLRLRPEGDRVVATVANAGHPGTLLLRADGTVEEVVADGLALALVDRTEYAETTAQLHPGDTVVLYTDGVTEARGRDDFFGEDRLRAQLSRLGGLPAAAVVESVALAVSEHLGDRQHDDIAVVAVQFRPEET
jgi:serine phosphatase RsbU (regulator of sigma subunit)